MSLDKCISGRACSYLPDGRVEVPCADSEMHSSLPFDEKNELQINTAAEIVQDAHNPSSGLWASCIS